MCKEIYRYAFTEEVPSEDIESSLVLAVMATESLHGESQVRMDAAHYFEPAKPHLCDRCGHARRPRSQSPVRRLRPPRVRRRLLPGRRVDDLAPSRRRSAHDLLPSSTRARAKPPRILVYGTEGIGKSTFGSQAPKPIFVQTEDGLGRDRLRQVPAGHDDYDDVDRR